MSNLTDCLRSSLQALRDTGDDVIDPEIRREVIEALEKTIAKPAKSADEQFARSLLNLREARRKVAVATFTKRATAAMEENIIARLGRLPDALLGSDELTLLMNRGVGLGHEGGSVESRWNARRFEALKELQPVLRELVDMRYGMPRKTELSDQFELGARGGAVDDPRAGELVKTWEKVSKRLLDEARAVGIYIPKLQHYFPQTYNVARVVADEAGFKDLMVRGLDAREFPDPAAAADELFDTLVNRHTDVSEANTLTLGRIFNMKTPELELELSRRFGAGAPHEIIAAYVNSITKKIALAEALGPKPATGFKMTSEIVQKRLDAARVRAVRARDPEAQRVVAKQQADHDEAKRAFDALTKNIQNPADQSGAAWVYASDGYVRAMWLGSVTYYAIPDVVSGANRAMLAGAGWRGIKDMLVGMRAAFGDGRLRDYVQDFNAELYHMGVASSAERFTTGDSLQMGDLGARAGAAQRARDIGVVADDIVQRVSFAHKLRQSARAGIALATGRNFARHLGKDWNKLPKAFRGLAENSGLTERLWNKMKDADAIDPFTGAVVASRLPKEAQIPFRAHVWRQVEIGQLAPMMHDRLRLGAYDVPTGAMDALFKRSKMFMASPYSFVMNSVRQQVHYGSTAGTATYAGAMLAAALVMVQLKSFISSGEPYDLANPELWSRAFISSGLFGPLGDALYSSAVGRGGSSGIPVIDFTGRFLGRGASVVDELADGEPDKAAFEALRMGEAITPNIWWLKAMTDRSIVIAAESLNPDYARYRRREAEKRLEGLLDN